MKSISPDIINYYVSYINESGFTVNAINISIIKRIIWENYDKGMTFQWWYTFYKGRHEDIEIKQSLLSAFENIYIYIKSDENLYENEKKTICS
jgi:hypothetical protein